MDTTQVACLFALLEGLRESLRNSTPRDSRPEETFPSSFRLIHAIESMACGMAIENDSTLETRIGGTS